MEGHIADRRERFVGWGEEIETRAEGECARSAYVINP